MEKSTIDYQDSSEATAVGVEQNPPVGQGVQGGMLAATVFDGSEDESRQEPNVVQYLKSTKSPGHLNAIEARPRGLLRKDSCAGRFGRDGLSALDPARRKRALAELRACFGPPTVASVLGVPAYCLPAFLKLDLLARTCDRNAERLAGVELLITKRSLKALVYRLEAAPLGRPVPCMTLQGALGGRFSPVAWVAAFKAIAEGKIKLIAVYSRATGGLTDRLMVDDQTIAEHLVTVSPQPVPRAEIEVDTDTAGLLLGMHGRYVEELIEAGFIGAHRREGSWSILLSSLVAFNRRFVVSLSPEWALAFGKSVGGFQLSRLPAGFKPVSNFVICKRSDFNKQVHRQR